MVSDYELVEYADPEGRPFWELTTSPENSQFQKMMSDPKTKVTARKMINQISKVYDYGLKDVSGTSKLRCIDPKIGLYELKGLMGLIEKWSTRFAKAWTRLFCFFGLRAIKAREIFPKKLNAQNSWPR